MFKKIKRSFQTISPFLPGTGSILAIILFEIVFWTSPEWTQSVRFLTYEGQRANAIAECRELLHEACQPRYYAVHDAGSSIPTKALPEWTPMRVERQFESGIAVVSALGPHGNYQYLVSDLSAAEGTTFRVFHERLIIL